MKKQTKMILASGVALALLLGQAAPTFAAKNSVVDKNKNTIPDSWELKYKLGLGKDVAKKDNDKDGLTNLLEYKLNYNPLVADTDRDKIADGNEDADKDQLTNVQETVVATDPTVADSDKDKVPDAQEDKDGDTLVNIQEFLAKFNPVVADSDKDGIADADEDNDKDGLSTKEEFNSGLNPTSSDSDKDGVKDGDEDSDKDGVKNTLELRWIDIDAITTTKKQIHIKLEVKGNNTPKVELKGEGITLEKVKSVLSTLKLTPTSKEQDIIAQLQPLFGDQKLAQFKAEFKFASGKKIKFNIHGDKFEKAKPDDKGKGKDDDDRDKSKDDDRDKSKDDDDDDDKNDDNGGDDVGDDNPSGDDTQPTTPAPSTP